jgi:hypothetical protein
MAIGRLTLIKHKVEKRGHDWVSLYQCNCGNEKLIFDSNVNSGKSRSCGCLSVEATKVSNSTHGLSNKPIYSRWKNMIRRCTDPKHDNYRWYGARGIRVCERWHNIENFLADMGMPPTSKHELDRIDSNGNYEPANCRWIPKRDQGRNLRSNRHLTANGKTQILSDWARETGISAGRISRRILAGWTVEEAVLTPVRPQRKAS